METSEIIDIYSTNCLLTDSSDISNCSNSNFDVNNMESIAANVTVFTMGNVDEIKNNSTSLNTTDSDKSSSIYSPLGSPENIMSFNYITEKINDLDQQLNEEKNNNAILQQDLNHVKKKLNTYQKYENNTYKDVV